MTHEILDFLPPECLHRLGSKPSVAVVYTSGTKYLVFGDDCKLPTYVIQVGEDSLLTAIYNSMSQLHKLLPRLISRPLSIIKLGRESALVVEGLAGLPWFVLQNHIRNRRDVDKIITLSVDALRNFHLASNSLSELRRITRLDVDFEHLCTGMRAVESLSKLNSRICINKISNCLAEFGAIELYPQHGDFCLNNLLFSADHAKVIDFEHYPVVYTPLHDAILLTDSLLNISRSCGGPKAAELWKLIFRESIDFEKNYRISTIIDCLFLMQLMWWVCETSEDPRRSQKFEFYRRSLLSSYYAFESGESQLATRFFERHDFNKAI